MSAAVAESEGPVEVSRTKDETDNVLPSVPANVCFTREEFVDESFSVDEFVKKHRKDSNLEQLREDLSAYLRSLRLSMIDLINEDYSDFVNLSSNLVGLDKNIGSVKQPLKVFREEVVAVDSDLSILIKNIDEKIKSLENIRLQKENLQRILYVSSVLKRIEELSSGYWDVSKRIPLPLLERFTIQMNEVNAILARITINIPFLERELKPKAAAITYKVGKSLEDTFSHAITDCNIEAFDLCVKICKLCRQIDKLENLMVVQFIRPYFAQIIVEENLERNGVQQFFDAILKFVKSDCRVLLESKADTSNFMLKSVWKEIAESLIIRANSLFSSGNPSTFHVNYKATQSFIQNFAIESKVELRLIQRERSYEELISKFNLNVYFHIRRHEIIDEIEKSLDEAFDSFNDSTRKIKLPPTSCLMNVIERIWSPDKIYIKELFHLFLKLTLQILNRFSFWLKNVSPPNSKKGTTTASTLFLLLGESEVLLKKVESFFEETIIPWKPEKCESDELKECFEESLDLIRNEGLPSVECMLREHLVKQCNEVLKQISDIPRLYRKTNREAPSKPSNYVNTCIDILKDFVISTNGKSCWKASWTIDILEKVTKTFKMQTVEVLTSVQKMEDSLRILNKVKGGQQWNNSSVSDDDKIRRQLNIDATEYANKIESCLGMNKSSVNGIDELLSLVETVKNVN